MDKLITFLDGKKRRIALACALTAPMVREIDIPGQGYIWLALIFLAFLFGGADALQAMRK